jgi:hypothetical protein
MEWRRLYFRAFNFLVRRVVAVGFVVIGSIVGLSGLPALLDPSAAVLWNGEPTTDLVIKAFGVVMPLVAAILGVLLFRAPAWYPAELRVSATKEPGA